MQIEAKRLPILLAVHREGGVVAAADALGITASAVSQQIRRLEAEVGLQLLERDPAGAILTPAGRIVVAGAEKLEADLTDLTHQLRPLTGHVTGTVHIGAFPTALRSILIPFLPYARQHLPGIDIELTEVDESVGMPQLRAGDLDVLIVERDTAKYPVPRGYVDAPLIDEAWVVVTPESWDPPAGMHDLGHLRWLQLLPGVVGAEPLRRIRAEIGVLEVTPYRYANYDAALAMLRAGLGATVLPSMAVTGIDTTGVRVTAMPGLGSRVISWRIRRSNANEAAQQVFSHLGQWAKHNVQPGD